MKKITAILGALLCGLSASAFAALTLRLTLDTAAAGPGQFAAGEIRREAAARGLSVIGADAKTPADAIHIKLTLRTPASHPKRDSSVPWV